MKSPELLGAARVRELLKRHDVRPAKVLGQNFVIDPNTIRKTLAVARIAPTDRILEIGPGAGSLTLGLAASAPSVIAVERDERLIPLLKEILADHQNVEVVHADAMSIDLAGTRATALVANLPYNIAALVVLKVLEEAPDIQSLTVMTQKEVGERLAADPGSKTYGATSVLVRFFGTARVEARVSRKAFWPVPRVDSVLVRIDRSGMQAEVEAQAFFKVVKAAFSQRRKTLRNSLTELAGSTERAENLLSGVGIDASRRAETLSFEEFLRVAVELN
jgi:16S rRNA (adenine1518-N6/adenine1519-N6)-dimethyltransferase